jgi:hypothetical protein
VLGHLLVTAGDLRCVPRWLLNPGSQVVRHRHTADTAEQPERICMTGNPTLLILREESLDVGILADWLLERTATKM